MSLEHTNLISVENICLDFEFKADSFRDSFNEFLAKHRSLLALDGESDIASGFLERIWPNGLPGSMIVSHGAFDDFDRYFIRPPVDGPNAHGFAYDGVTSCFGVYRNHGRLIVDSFCLVPHVPPRAYERYVTGAVHINSKTASMAMPDFTALGGIKLFRKEIALQLTQWKECLAWQKDLVLIHQDAFRYVGYQVGDDGLVRFLIRAEKGFGRLGKSSNTIMLAAPLTDSMSADHWKPSSKKPSFTRLGNVTTVKRIKSEKISERFDLSEEVLQDHDFALITIKPQFDSGQMEGMTENIIPTEGFLITSVGGEIKPITSAQRAIRRLQFNNSSNCYLPEFCFNIENALKPVVIEDHFQNIRLPFRLNDDQRQAANKILSAPEIALLQGPPGTGKTTVIGVVAFLESLRGKKVLISSQTNIAIDNVLSRLSDDPAIRPLRIFDLEDFFLGRPLAVGFERPLGELAVEPVADPKNFPTFVEARHRSAPFRLIIESTGGCSDCNNGLMTWRLRPK